MKQKREENEKLYDNNNNNEDLNKYSESNTPTASDKV